MTQPWAHGYKGNEQSVDPTEKTQPRTDDYVV